MKKNFTRDPLSEYLLEEYNEICWRKLLQKGKNGKFLAYKCPQTHSIKDYWILISKYRVDLGV